MTARHWLRRNVPILAIALACALGSRAAHAQKDDALTRARILANEGGDLLDRKQYEEALDKVTQAEALFHAPTHLLMIGDAQESLGRLADATLTYEKLAAEPMPAKAPPAFKKAQEEGQKRLRALLARVPSILVEPHGPEAGAARATLDGKAIDLGSGIATRADPGEHQLRVEADGFATVERKVKLPEKGGVVKIDVALKPAESPHAEEAPAPTAPEEPAARGADAGGLGPKVPALVAFGIGAAGIGFGVVTGIMSLNQVSELDQKCPGGKCTSAQQPIIDKAGTLGTLSTIGFAVGGAGLIAGVVLLVTAPSPAHPAEPTAKGWPTVGIGPGTIRVAGTF